MQQVKLSTVKDGKQFIISAKTKIAYRVTKKVKGGVLITAVDSQRTYTKKGSTKVICL